MHRQTIERGAFNRLWRHIGQREVLVRVHILDDLLGVLQVALGVEVAEGVGHSRRTVIDDDVHECVPSVLEVGAALAVPSTPIHCVAQNHHQVHIRETEFTRQFVRFLTRHISLVTVVREGLVNEGEGVRVGSLVVVEQKVREDGDAEVAFDCLVTLCLAEL